MQEIDLNFVWQVMLMVAFTAAVAIASPWFVRQYHAIMSRRSERAATADLANAPVHVPVQPHQYSAEVPNSPRGSLANSTTSSLADTDAPDGGTDWQPRLPRYPTEEELVIYLATVRDRRGKHLRSANQIAAFSTLHRNEVLRLVKEVREGVPEYRPLTPEQRELRERLELQPSGRE